MRYGQYDSDGILVFPGNGKRFAGDFDDVGRGEHRFRHVDKEGTVNAQEAVAQEVLPLGNAHHVPNLLYRPENRPCRRNVLAGEAHKETGLALIPGVNQYEVIIFFPSIRDTGG